MKIDILNQINNLSTNKKVIKLLIDNLGKILLKQDNINLFMDENKNKIMHIRDWINSVVENGEEWKVQRVLTVEALNNAADKYFQKKNNNLQKMELNEQEEKIIADLGEYYIVQMLTAKALDNESKQMNHCIGHGGYDERLKDKNYIYLSLRDKFNKSHVTLEIYKKKILQLHGKQNKFPIFKYLYDLIPWLIDNNYHENIYWKKVGKYYDKKWFDFKDIELIENIDYKIEKNIDGFKIYKDISKKFKDKYMLMEEKEEEFVCISKDFFQNTKININVFGNEINGDKYSKVIDYLKEKKYLFCEKDFGFIFNLIDNKYYYIYDLPNIEFTVNNLRIIKSKIKKLPDNFTVLGDLYIYDCPLLCELPKNLTVKGDLWIPNTNIKKIGDNINIQSKLNISDSEVEKLSDNLICKKIIISEKQISLIKETMDFQRIFVSNKHYNKHDSYTKEEFFENFKKNNNFKL